MKHLYQHSIKLLSKYTILYLAIIILLSSCSLSPKKRGGVAFCFDDQNVKEWVEHKDLFNQYNIKATFFINRPQLLDSAKIKGLKTLEKQGHEIGCHGLNHKNVSDFKDFIEKYRTEEVLPAKQILTQLGFDIVSFAYPFGNAFPQTDSMLIKDFKYLRKASYNKKDTTLSYYDNIYANANSFNIVNAMGIDCNYKITFDNFETGLKRAKENNEVLIVYAHIIDTTKRNYTINPKDLETYFQLAQKYKLQSIRMRDLENFYK